MNELSAFIDAHPYVTFGVFWIAGTLAVSIGKIGRRCGKEGR